MKKTFFIQVFILLVVFFEFLFAGAFVGEDNIVTTDCNTVIIDEVGISKKTNLFDVAAKGPVDLLFLLLAQDFDDCATHSYFSDPLFLAINGRDVDAVRYLLNSDHCHELNNALFYVFTGYCNVKTIISAEEEAKVLQIVELLLVHGADINAINRWDGFTILMYAASKGYKSIVRYLLENGADVNIVTDKGYAYPRTALLCAKNAAIADLLIQHGALVNVQRPFYKRQVAIVQNAVTSGDLELVEFLLKNGADINEKNAEGDSILLFAKDAAMLKLLIDYGADVNAQGIVGKINNKKRDTALIAAVCDKKNDSVRLLLEQGAAVNADGFWGMTALMHAACDGNEYLVNLLLAYGADVNAVSSEGYTSLIEAAKNGHLAIVKILIEKGALVNAATYRTFVGFVSGCEYGKTALMYAAENGYTLVVEYLWAQGADVTIKSRYGNTAFDLAIKNRELEVVEFFNRVISA